MVLRDMVRARPLPLLIAALAAVALVVTLVVATSVATTSSEQRTVVTATKVAASRTVPSRAPRPVPPLVPLALLLAGLGSPGLLLARHDRLIGRRLRRLHDVGHDWRSLLLGAPPALA